MQARYASVASRPFHKVEGQRVITVLQPSPSTTVVIFCACFNTVNTVLQSWAGAANKSIMATIVSGSFDGLTVELYAAHVRIFGFSDSNLAIDCPSDHAKSSRTAASVMSGDGVVAVCYLEHDMATVLH